MMRAICAIIVLFHFYSFHDCEKNLKFYMLLTDIDIQHSSP
jgi:hypothetical protein